MKHIKYQTIEQTDRFVYKIKDIGPDIIKRYTTSPHATEGEFGFEILKRDKKTEIITFAPSMEQRLGDGTVFHIPAYNENIAVYELRLSAPFFLPLYHEPLTLPEVDMFVQVLFKKAINWRDKAISQYEQYLNGVDHPSNNTFLRLFQGTVLGILKKIGQFDKEREAQEEIEQKILGDLFSAEFRYILFDKGMQPLFEKKMTEQLLKLDYFNRLELVKHSNPHMIYPYIQKRILQSRYQLVSANELECVLTIAPINQQQTILAPTPSPPLNITSEKNEGFQYVMDILPGFKVDKEVVDETNIKKLSDSLKRIKITQKAVAIHSVVQGSTLQKITIQIPKDIVYTRIEKNLKNIQAAMGNDAISVEIGDSENTADFYIPRTNRTVVYLKKLMDTSGFIQKLKEVEIPIIIGEDTVGRPLVTCISELKHLLVAGTTGSGKSVYLNSLIVSLLMFTSPKQLKLMLIDPKQVELNHFKDFSNVTFIDDMDAAANVFQLCVVEMEERYKKMAAKGYKNIQQYNDKEPEQLPYIIVVVDELADLMDTHKDEIEDFIIRLGQKARACGIHMILCTQKPSVDVITSRIKSNLPSAISFRLKAQTDYRTVFGKGIPYTLLGKGDGVVMLEGGTKEFIRFQSPIISMNAEEERKVYARLKQFHQQNMSKEVHLLEQLKQYILETGETRIVELQKYMQIRINVVSDLMKQLVDEGFLKKEKKSYTINNE